MKRIALIMMIVAAFAFALAGCSGTESGQTEENTAATEAETEAEATTEAAQEETTAAEKPTGTQTITMGNVEMDIPAAWVYDAEDGAEMTHIYRNADGSVEFQIQAMQTGDDVTEQTLGEMTQQCADEWGYGDIGYYDTTLGGGAIEGKIIPVDPSQHPDGKFQRIYTLGKDKTFVSISFEQEGEDTTDMNKAVDSVHWLN